MRPTDLLVVETKTRNRRRRVGACEEAQARTGRSLRNDPLPHLSIVSWPIAELRLPVRQVRKVLPAQIERVKESIKAFGLVQPALARKSGEIIDGWIRVEAARQLGLTEIPTIIVDHLSDADLRALRVGLNRTAERGQWDFNELTLELEELISLEAPIDAIGFSLPEIEAMTLAEITDQELDEIPALDPERPVSWPGAAWRLGQHLLVCGDALKPETYAALLGREAVRLVLTDMPYNVKIKGHVTSGDHAEFAMASGEMTPEAFIDFILAWMKACSDVLVAGGLIGTFIDWRSIEPTIACGRELELDLLNLIVWAKSNGGMGSLWRSQHELLPIFKKPGAAHVNNVELGKHGRWRSNVWQYAGASSLGSDAREGLADHPTVKPVALLEDALLDITNRDDLVLDPFVGSGSTLIACQTTGRRCRAIEIEPAYVDVVVRRWQALTGRPAICEETGATFDEIAAPAAADTDTTNINSERGGA